MKFEKIDYIVHPLKALFRNEAVGGVLLFLCALIAMLWANSQWAHLYHELWDYKFSITLAGNTIDQSIHHWINDGLMAMFFFVVGLELKSEIMAGHLSSFKDSLLPLAAAIGGMLVPALLFVAFNSDKSTIDGWGIPMATDIAFALGIMALLGKRVPLSLKVFLTALAIGDDIGAVMVIALFYTSEISLVNLGTGAFFLVILLLGNYLGVRSALFYGIVGIIGLWLAFLMSGIHPTIAGVFAAFAIPARSKIDETEFTNQLHDKIEEFDRVPPNNLHLLEPQQMRVLNKIKLLIHAAETPLQRLLHALYPLVTFLVVPLFALANSGITITATSWEDALHPVSIGVFIGLIVGKPIGILLICYLFVKLNLAKLPDGVTWNAMAGVSMLAGIGFTMSMFITNLAYSRSIYVLHAKMGVLAASLVAGLLGYIWLRMTLDPDKPSSS